MKRTTSPKNIPLWGSVLSARPGHVRHRPTGQALLLTNKVLGGDLLETKHSAGEPTFTGQLVEGKGRKGDKEGGKADEMTFPAIHSYAFKDGKKRGVILFNFDIGSPQEVELKFAGSPKSGATTWTLTAPTPISNNEYESGEPSVKINESKVASFASGHKVAMAPHSMQVFQWEE